LPAMLSATEALARDALSTIEALVVDGRLAADCRCRLGQMEGLVGDWAIFGENKCSCRVG
jgi:hypothetical protein